MIRLPSRFRLESLLARSRRSRREAGYVAVVTALVFASFGFGCAAIGVDTARWWLAAGQVQKAADMASLAGVTYLPQDLASAQTTAIDVAGRNGFPNSGLSSVTATTGSKPSQLRVTVCSTIENSFGAVIGIKTTTVCRSAVADYTGPAPMGSPCNTFGNEPDGGNTTKSLAPKTGTAQAPSASRYANCKSNPKMWGVIGGPASDKGNGDRFMTRTCSSSGFDGCSGSTNSEYDDDGYFWLVRVQPAAVGKTIDLQLYDPEYSPTSKTVTVNNVKTVQPCGYMPANTNFTDAANDYVADGKARYGSTVGSAGSTGAPYCNGDLSYNQSSTPTIVTSFALRQQTDSLNPRTAPVQNDTSGAACIKQYRAAATPDVDALTKGKADYNDQLAQVFHNWTRLCSFTPDRAGDYYVQVRTNITFAGTTTGNTNGNSNLISTGNTAVLGTTPNLTSGNGANSFSMRAVLPGYENAVSVSGYDRMPIYANGDTTTSQFNLIRVVPAGAGKSIAFTYFDVGDSSDGAANVTVIPPTDAKTSGNNTAMSSQSNAVKFPGGCKATGGAAGTGATYSSCVAPVDGGTGGANNGHVENLNIPIPNDYTCNYTSPGGCWYQVSVSFTGSAVTDLTTWTATVTGDPVRLIE